MATVQQTNLPVMQREDTWAIVIALSIVAVVSSAFFFDKIALLKSVAIHLPTWSADFGAVSLALCRNMSGLLLLLLAFLCAFGFAAHVMGYSEKYFLLGFLAIFGCSVLVIVLGAHSFLKYWQIETPLIALILGMGISNTIKLPEWFQVALRTEFYVKTGIILMGATLPFTIIMQAGLLSIIQASIVAIITFATIFFVATRWLGLDPRLGACLGAGGSICGVSAAIAVGGACKADKEQVSVSISIVILWAIIMIFLLPFWAKALEMQPGPAGAWIGNSEFADAAGFAAVSNIGDERAVKTFTLMKVVGRDMFVGVWALLASFLSIAVWGEKTGNVAQRLDLGEIWRRFPKFVVGFFVASIITTIIITLSGPQVGQAYSKEALGVIKTLRGWAFAWTFLSIGFTTRFRELTSFGWKPLTAFSIGVAVNVPLGYWLSNVVFLEYWLNIK